MWLRFQIVTSCLVVSLSNWWRMMDSPTSDTVLFRIAAVIKCNMALEGGGVYIRRLRLTLHRILHRCGQGAAQCKMSSCSIDPQRG